MAFAIWLADHWYWPVLICMLLFATGVYLNWQREKRREKLTDAELRAIVGDGPRSPNSPDNHGVAQNGRIGPAGDLAGRGRLAAAASVGEVPGTSGDGSSGNGGGEGT
jgi:hypothetical protein